MGSIGDIRTVKGYDILFHAAAEVKKRNREVEFIIAGQGAGELSRELLALRRI